MADGNPLIIGRPNLASNPGAQTSLSRNETLSRTVFVVQNLNQGNGLRVEAARGIAVHGSSSGTGVVGRALGPGADAALFDGNLSVINGSKNFKIDHPLDPENKYLLHIAVESSERKNVYDGVARLDKDGAAEVELPE
jgi:hypothetical protein